MNIYYLYSKQTEITSYISLSLSKYKIMLLKNSSDLFDIDEKDSLLILHIDSYDENTVELVNYLIKEFKDLKILALSNNVNYLEGVGILQAGVKGYGNVYMHSVLLEQAVDVIMSDNVWIYPELANHLIKNLAKDSNKDKLSKLEKLSEHEKECAILAADGNSNKDIATLLNLQEITIKKHLSSAYKKLSLKNRIELALYIK